MGSMIQNRRVARRLGVCLATVIFCASAVPAGLSSCKNSDNFIVAGRAESQPTEKTQQIDTISVPFYESIQQNSRGDSEKIHEVYARIVQTERQRQQEPQHTASDDATTVSTTASSQQETESTTSENSTATTTASTSAEHTPEPTQTLPGETVSNGQLPFNYHDVSSIASELSTLEDFVKTLRPVSFSWDTSEYPLSGDVKISLASPSGSITLEVKPCGQDPLEYYVIEGDTKGSVNMTSLDELEWYRQNRGSGACICSVTWLRSDYSLEPVRGIDVGTGLGELTARYLCVNGGGTTLYKASDVIADESKRNALAASENLYTFVGGRLYTMEGYLERYYSGAEESYLFEDCDMVVQYGCNSITEHNYTTGSWLIEYAIKDDTVAGIVFINKSYYKTNVVRGGSTSSHTDSAQTQTLPEETSGTGEAVTEETTAGEQERQEQPEENLPTTENSAGTANLITSTVETVAEQPLESGDEAESDD